MAKTTTVEALRKRGILKKDAEKLAELGYNLSKLKKAKVDDIKKHFSKKKASEILNKISKTTSEKGKKEKKKKMEKAPKKPKIKMVIPKKIPEMNEAEKKIFVRASKMDIEMPMSIISAIAKKVEGKRLNSKEIDAIIDATKPNLTFTRTVTAHDIMRQERQRQASSRTTPKDQQQRDAVAIQDSDPGEDQVGETQA